MGRKIFIIIAIALLIVSFLSMSSLSLSTNSGFGKIKPMEPSIELSSDGVLSAAFMNGAGQGIILNKLDISHSGTKCKVTFPDKDDNNADNLSLPIGAGGVFLVEAQCPTENFNSETLRFLVDIEYTLTIAGTVVTHNERGTMSAVYEVEVERKRSREQVYNMSLILILFLVFLLVIRKYRKRKSFKIKKELKELFMPTLRKIGFIFVLFFFEAAVLWGGPFKQENLTYVARIMRFLVLLPQELFFLVNNNNGLHLDDSWILLIGISMYIAYNYLISCFILRAIQVLRE